MKIEIWSDIICPFCYIGKRKFETALEQFEYKDKIELEWKSFQLNPNQESNPDKSVIENLAENKGQTIEWSEKAHAHVTRQAKEVGLDYNFGKAKIANTFKAHSLLQMAKEIAKGNEVKELLCKAYFTDGLDISNHDVLVKIGEKVGLKKADISQALEKNTYGDAVNNDVMEARQLRINAVPFFVFNRKYGVSGAQDPKVFLQSLIKSYEEWQVTHAQHQTN